MADLVQQKKRILYFDYIKAFCIISVMIAHLYLLPSWLSAMWIMPPFFVIAGCTFRIKDESFKDFFLNKFRRLMVPYFCAYLVSIPAEILRAEIYKYGNWKMILHGIIGMVYGSAAAVPCPDSLNNFLKGVPSFHDYTAGLLNAILPLNCHLWFLPAMFSATIFTYIYVRYFRKNLLTDMIAVILLAAFSAVESVPGMFQFPFGIGRGAIGSAMMIAGMNLKEREIYSTSNPLKIVIVLAAAALLSWITIATGSQNMGMITSYYGKTGIWGTFFTWIASLGTTVLLIYVFRLFDMIPFSRLKGMLVYLGQHSMSVYLWHLIVIFAVDLVFTAITRHPVKPRFYLELFTFSDLIWYRILKLFIVLIVLIVIPEKLLSKKRDS